MYAIENNIDEQFGLDLEMVMFSSGATMNEAMASNQFDVALIGGAGIYGIATYDGVYISDQVYYTKVDDGDEVIYARGCNDDDILCVITKTNGETIYPISEIPTLGRSAKGKKLIPVPNGDCIINVCIDQPGP